MSTRLALPVSELRAGNRCCTGDGPSAITDAEAAHASTDFEILANPIRLQLLDVLARNAGLVCVCDLEAAVPVKQPTVSHHLKLLRGAGLVSSERRGLYQYYHIDQKALRALRRRITNQLAAFG